MCLLLLVSLVSVVLAEEKTCGYRDKLMSRGSLVIPRSLEWQGDSCDGCIDSRQTFNGTTTGKLNPRMEDLISELVMYYPEIHVLWVYAPKADRAGGITTEARKRFRKKRGLPVAETQLYDFKTETHMKLPYDQRREKPVTRTYYGGTAIIPEEWTDDALEVMREYERLVGPVAIHQLAFDTVLTIAGAPC